jgi:hypothetical protein
LRLHATREMKEEETLVIETSKAGPLYNPALTKDKKTDKAKAQSAHKRQRHPMYVNRYSIQDTKDGERKEARSGELWKELIKPGSTQTMQAPPLLA